MALNMKWLGTSCLQLVLPGDIHIVLDPYMDDSHNSPIDSDAVDRCDYIFLTHGHWDHVLDVGKLAGRFAPPVYCNRDTAETMVEHQKVDRASIHTISAGDTVKLPGFTVEVLPGVHTNPAKEFKRVFGKELPGPEAFSSPMERLKAIAKISRGTDQIPDQYPVWRNIYKGGEQLNFIFEGEDGQRIYIAGSYPDSKIREVAKGVRADITLLQCMSANMLKGIEEETAEVAMASGCKTVIPQHHDPILKGGRETDLSMLKKILKEASDMAFLEMAPGDWYTFKDGLEDKR